ncbi:MAG: UDP-2,3-diacylglucosamine diphosphatase LpxI [Hyphomicrobium sp.]|jgi:DUF1009 family protein
MPGQPRVVGIVAGGGSLPREIAEHVKANGGTVHIVSIIGEGDRDLSDFPLTKVGWAQIGGMVRALRNAAVTEMVIVGSVRRPDLAAIKPDLGFFLNLPAIARVVATTGDDGVLSGVVRFFESKGFKVVSPVEVAPGLLVGEGPIGALKAEAHEMVDIARGFDVVRALGPFDVGQAVVVTQGRLEAIEGAENTDAMLARLALQRRLPEGGVGPRRGVLVKRPKPRQEMRVDMPAIGPGTVTRALEAGLRGVAVLAKGAIALGRAELVRSADAGGLFIEGVVDRGVAIAAAPLDFTPAFVRLGDTPVDARQLADAARGAALLHALKPFRDSGGSVIDRGHVLAVECGEGIAALIARSGALRQWGRRRWARRSAVAVVSAAVAADLASVISAATSAQLAGVAVVGGTADALAHGIELADKHGLFLLAAPSGGAP